MASFVIGTGQRPSLQPDRTSCAPQQSIRRYFAIPVTFFFWKEVMITVALRHNTNGTRNGFEILLLLGAILFWAVALPLVSLFFLAAGALQGCPSGQRAFVIRA